MSEAITPQSNPPEHPPSNERTEWTRSSGSALLQGLIRKSVEEPVEMPPQIGMPDDSDSPAEQPQIPTLVLEGGAAEDLPIRYSVGELVAARTAVSAPQPSGEPVNFSYYAPYQQRFQPARLLPSPEEVPIEHSEQYELDQMASKLLAETLRFAARNNFRLSVNKIVQSMRLDGANDSPTPESQRACELLAVGLMRELVGRYGCGNPEIQALMADSSVSDEQIEDKLREVGGASVYLNIHPSNMGDARGRFAEKIEGEAVSTALGIRFEQWLNTQANKQQATEQYMPKPPEVAPGTVEFSNSALVGIKNLAAAANGFAGDALGDREAQLPYPLRTRSAHGMFGLPFALGNGPTDDYIMLGERALPFAIALQAERHRALSGYWSRNIDGERLRVTTRGHLGSSIEEISELVNAHGLDIVAQAIARHSVSARSQAEGLRRLSDQVSRKKLQNLGSHSERLLDVTTLFVKDALVADLKELERARRRAERQARRGDQPQDTAGSADQPPEPPTQALDPAPQEPSPSPSGPQDDVPARREEGRQGRRSRPQRR